ncbi:MAG: hypothetical protein PHO67_07860 [Candidatus Omnitrophica bacterium]|nr:hypothetical protein [Candidatus Omnitrophota bacterium]
MGRKKKPPLVLEEKIAIDSKGLLQVERPQAKLGFLNVEVKGEAAGRILFDRRPGKTRGELKLWFNQTAFAVNSGESRREREMYLGIRKAICEKLGAVDVNKDQ